MEIPTTEPPRIKGHYCQVSPEAMEKFLEGSVVGIFSCRWVDSLCGWATPRRTSATPRDVPCLRPWAYPDYTPGGTHPGKAIPSTRTTKAGSVFSTPAARKPATMNGSIPFPYYMWYSTISMYPTLDPLPSPPTRLCMSHPHLTVRLPRPRLHKLLIPIRSFTNTLQSVQVPLLTVIAHL